MKKRYFLTVACLLVTVSTAAIAGPVHDRGHDRGQERSQEPRHESGYGPGRSMDLGGLRRPAPAPSGPQPDGFSPTREQMMRMEGIEGRYGNDIRELRSQVLMRHVEMDRLSSDPNTKQSTLIAKEKELNLLRSKLSEKRTQMRIELRTPLTDPYFEKHDATTKKP